MEIVYILVGLVTGFGLGWLVAHNKSAAMTQKANMLEALNAQQKQEQELQLQQEIEKGLRQQQQLHQQYEQQAEQQKQNFDQQLKQLLQDRQEQQESLRKDYERQLANLKADHDKQLTLLRQEYEQQQQRQRKDHEQQMEQQAKLIREQINSASEEILRKRSEELSNTNREQLSNILIPLHEKLKQMREAVERNDQHQTTSLERLDAAIKANLQQAQEVGERADKLAQALTSENKTQGNFGELRLRTLLENMGLEEGVQFEEQVTMRDAQGQVLYEEESGRRMIPDVILHFPDQRDVIIDSKMSLTAYKDYFEAKTDTAREQALARHISSMRNHVKELVAKGYNKHANKQHRQPDFVVMYVYSESALQLALANDANLWKEAYDAGVIISGSQTLYMMLRVLEMTWNQVKQAKNQDEMMKTANEIVNRVQMFYERFMAVDEQLRRTREAFDKLKTNTAPTGPSIVTAANNLLKFGAKENPKRKAKLPKDNAELPVSEAE